MSKKKRGRPFSSSPKIEAALILKFDLNNRAQRAVYGYLTYDKCGNSSKGNAKAVVVKAVLDYMNQTSGKKMLPDNVPEPVKKIQEPKFERQTSNVVDDDISGELDEIEEMFGGA